MKNKKLIGLFGFGNIGEQHLRTFIDLQKEYPIEVLGIARATEKPLSTELRALVGDIPIYTGSSTYLLDNSNLICIASPDDTHWEYAAQALCAGIPTWVEKPLVLEEGQGKELVSLARQGNISFGTLTQMSMHRPDLDGLVFQVSQTSTIFRMGIVYMLPTKPPRANPPVIQNILPHPLSIIPDLSDRKVEDVKLNEGEVRVELTGEDFPISIDIGYVPKEEARRKIILYTNSGKVERTFRTSFTKEEGYTETWISRRPNPRRDLWRRIFEDLFAQDISEKRQACFEQREGGYQRTLQENELLMQAMEI